MFERGISETDVNRVLVDGEVIQTYPDDTPYPSRLMLGWLGSDRSMWWLRMSMTKVPLSSSQSMNPIRRCGTRISRGEGNHEMRYL